ncbi:MAG: prohibitin family protein [Gammaproteobacteria bacterium]
MANSNFDNLFNRIPHATRWMVVAIIAILVYMSLYIVAPGERGVLVTLGHMSSDIKLPGPHLRIPFVQTYYLMNVQVTKYENEETAASKDLQNTFTKVALNYTIDPSEVTKLYQNVGTQDVLTSKVIEPIMSNAVKAVTAHYNAEDLIAQRDTVRAGIEKEIKDALKQYDIDVQGVNITNFRFSEAYANAIEAKQVAQQNALKATYELQKVQTEAQQRVANAEADAKATVLNAQAQAKAMALKDRSVTDRILVLNAIDKWDGHYPTTLLMTGSGKGSPLMNVLELPHAKK